MIMLIFFKRSEVGYSYSIKYRNDLLYEFDAEVIVYSGGLSVFSSFFISYLYAALPAGIRLRLDGILSLD
jgi:hypothetical protein